jgi:hypothetical protein
MDALLSVSAESSAPIRCLTLGAALPASRPAGVIAGMTKRAHGVSPDPEAPPCGVEPGGLCAEGTTVANEADD